MLKKSKKRYIYYLFLFFIIFSFTGINKAFSATVNFSPSTATYHVGDSIRIKVNVLSTDKSINALSGMVSFPNDILSITSISKTPSLISLWSHDPTYSNINGTANFEGVILNGYIGSSGNILTLVFKANKVGTANLKFSNVSILANNGNGTEVYSGPLGESKIIIEKAIPKEEPKVEEKTSPVETVVEVTQKAVEKIGEVEVSNNLPNHSLLITVIVLLIILLNLIIIYAFFFFFKLKNHIKKKLMKTEKMVDEDFKKLEKKIEQKNKDNSDIIKEVSEVEEKIISEIEKTEEEI